MEFFQRFRCCGCGWELVPVDDCPGEKGIPVGLTGGSLLVELVASTGSTVTTTHIGTSPFPHPQDNDQFYTSWRVCCLVASSIMFPILIFLHLSHTARCLCCVVVENISGSSLLDLFQGLYCWTGWLDPTLMRHTRELAVQE